MKNNWVTAAMAATVLVTAAGCGAAEPEPDVVPTIHVEEPMPEESAPEKGISSNESVETQEEGQVYLPGKIREIGDNSVVISRTFVEDSVVYIPEEGSQDEELVTVRFMDDTEFEHWTIVGGGADIKRREASFSDITQDCGLELYGYYENDEFVAKRVLIEIDV